MPEIKIMPNGPYFIGTEDITLVDAQGNAIEPPRRPFALCRCGQSANRPFCDGTHARIGWDGTLACDRVEGAA